VTGDEIRIFARRQVEADPAGVALLLSGPTFAALWPPEGGAEQVAEHDWRTTIQDAHGEPMVSLVHLDAADQRGRRPPQCRFRIEVEDGTALTGMTTVTRRRLAEHAPAAVSTVSVYAFASGPRASALPGPIARFLRNVAGAAERRRYAI
jgi:hypothetical protein